jgi:hypothetical protein
MYSKDFSISPNSIIFRENYQKELNLRELSQIDPGGYR